MNKVLISSAMGLVTLTASFAGLAQAQTFAPQTADPGVIARELTDENRGPGFSDEAIALPRYDEPELELSEEKMLTFQGVQLEGSSVYTEDQLAYLYSDYQNQEVSFADLHRIAQGMTRRYREDGYIFSRVILPPQNIEDGIVRFQAVEGRLTNVEIVGDYKDTSGLIERMADKIMLASGPANSHEIERYLLLIDDLPGIRARSIVRPSDVQSGSELIITVEQDLFEGSFGFDNRGSRYVGPYRASLITAFNSVFGLHDRTTIRGIGATQLSELRYIDIVHEEQLGSDGLRLIGRAAFTRTEPGGNIEALDIEGDSELFDLSLQYPLIRSRRSNLNLFGGLGALDAETDILGGAVETNDRIRTARVGAEFDFVDQWGINRFDATLTKGLDGFGATDDGLGRSRVNGEHDFIRWNFNASRVQQLYGNFSALISGAAQLTGEPLLSSEEFSVGGPGFGRAYDAGEISGDRGWATGLELRYSDAASIPSVQDYQLYGFIDYGRIDNIDPVVGENDDASVTSYGGGMRFNMDYDFSGNLELAVPVSREVAAEGDDGARVFFNILKRF